MKLEVEYANDQAIEIKVSQEAPDTGGPE